MRQTRDIRMWDVGCGMWGDVGYGYRLMWGVGICGTCARSAGHQSLRHLKAIRVFTLEPWASGGELHDESLRDQWSKTAHRYIVNLESRECLHIGVRSSVKGTSNLFHAVCGLTILYIQMPSTSFVKQISINPSKRFSPNSSLGLVGISHLHLPPKQVRKLPTI